jgi:starch phosphorylase
VVTTENNLPADGPENGVEYTFKFVVDEQGLNDAVGLEFVSIATDKTGRDYVHDVHPFEVVAHAGNLYTFECDLQTAHAGSYKAAVRMFPKNDKLPHRQDFAYVKWLEY